MIPARGLSERGVVPASVGLGIGFAIALQPQLTVVALVGAIGALVGVVYPTSLVAFMFLGVLFDRLGLTGASISGFPITASKLSVLAGLGLWGVHAGLSRAPPARWHPVLGTMVGVIAMTAISVALANSMAEGKFDLFGLAMMTVMVGLVYTILAEAPLTGVYRVVGMALAAACLASLRPTAGDRATGTMGDPNEWGAMVLLLTPTTLGGLADDPSGMVRPLRVLLLLLAPLAILRTESRTALLVGVLVAPAVLYLLRRQRAELLGGLALAAAAAPFVVSLDAGLARLRQLIGNLQGSASVQDASLEERSELFRQGRQLFHDHWLLGVGPGNFSRATGFVSHTGELRPAHNTYLEVASEQGVIGLIPFGIFAASVFVTLRRAARGAATPVAWNRVFGVSVGLAALALMAATLGLLTFSMAYLVLGLGLAVATQASEPHVRTA